MRNILTMIIDFIIGFAASFAVYHLLVQAFVLLVQIVIAFGVLPFGLASAALVFWKYQYVVAATEFVNKQIDKLFTKCESVREVEGEYIKFA